MIVLDDAVKDAIENRPELQRLKLAREINAINIDYFKNQTKPQIDLNTNFSLNGLSQGITNNSEFTVPQFTGNDEILRLKLNTLLPANMQIPNPLITVPAASSFLVGGFNRSLLNLFRSDAPNYTVGVTFSFPLRNRTAKANLAGARDAGRTNRRADALAGTDDNRRSAQRRAGGRNGSPESSVAAPRPRKCRDSARRRAQKYTKSDARRRFCFSSAKTL